MNFSFLQLQTPLGDFALTDVSGTEAVSKLFQFNLTAYSENISVQPAQLISKPVTFKIGASESSVRIFNGVISKFAVGEMKKGMREYYLEVVPALWLLNFSSDCKIFEKKTVVEIVKEFCEKFNIKMDHSCVRGKYLSHEYCVQYNESALNFINRLLEQEGIFYFFRHRKDEHILILMDSDGSCESCKNSNVIYTQGSHDEHLINYWKRQYQFYSGKYAHADYDFEKPGTSLVVDHDASPKLESATKCETFCYPGGHREYGIGKDIAQKRHEANEATYEVIEGGSNCSGFMAGHKFKLTEHPSSSELGEYMLLSVTHHAFDHSDNLLQQDDFTISHGYSNTFSCVPVAVKYRAQTLTAAPVIVGKQTAIVVGDGQAGQEVAVDQYGRILVRFHWDRENKSSCRVRVAQNWAGKNWGMVFHPRIGQEVVVAFEHGDPDRPIVIGSVYNAEQMPPYELASNHTQSGIKTKTVQGNGNNELRIEDKVGAEEIYIHAQKDLVRVIENTETVQLNKGDLITKISAGKSTLEAAQSIEFKVGSNHILIDQQGVYINGSQVKVNG